jgi:hypothetical protein
MRCTPGVEIPLTSREGRIRTNELLLCRAPSGPFAPSFRRCVGPKAAHAESFDPEPFQGFASSPAARQVYSSARRWTGATAHDSATRIHRQSSQLYPTYAAQPPVQCRARASAPDLATTSMPTHPNRPRLPQEIVRAPMTRGKSDSCVDPLRRSIPSTH